MIMRLGKFRCSGIALTAIALAFGTGSHLTRLEAQSGPQTVRYRVNAGGASVSAAPNWSGDTSSAPSPYSNVAAAGSRTFSTGAAVNVSHPTLPAGIAASLFQTERHDRPGGAEMQWSFPVTPGSYEVRLYFAEIFFTSPGQRVFDVFLEGTLVLHNYDIVSDVGAFTGVMKSFTVTTDASLDILFNRVIENPKVSAIEIVDLSVPQPGEIGVSPESVEFGAVLVGQASARAIELRNLGGPGDPSIDVYATTIAGADANQFADNFNDAVPITLAPGQSTTITVTFGPSTIGTKAAALEISHFGAASPAIVPLGGTGTTIPAGAWQTRAPTGLPRQEVSYVQSGGKFYLAGGSTAHEVYDPATNTWATLLPLPVNLDHIQGVALGGHIYYIGGLLGWPQPASSAVYIYNPSTDSTTQGAPMPRPRGAGGVAVHNGKIYYAGGLAAGTAVSWFDVYDPAANTWTTLPDMPVARDHFHAAVVGGKFYVTGGRATSINATITSTIAFDFGTGTWKTSGLAPIPTARGGFGAAVLGTEILVIGGEGGGSTFSTVEAYNTATNTWRTLAPMPTPRHGIQAAECNGGIYVAGGGGTQGGSSPTNVHQVFFLGSATTCGSTAPPPPPASGAVYRVNAGGPQVTGTPNWIADSPASIYSNAAAAGSRAFATSASINVSHPSIPAGTPATVFQSERYDPPAGSDMQWSFPVAAGSYEVRLYFAEVFFTSPGARVFNVAIEGNPVLTNYDIVADVGAFTGVVKAFTVAADDSLDILFSAVVENPKINAIEILDATPRPGELGVSPSSVAFGSAAVGQASARTVTLRNLGASGDPGITISGTTISGAHASQFGDDFNDAVPVTLAPGQSTAITVTFTPTSAGAKTAALHIGHSGVNGSPLSVPLSGSGSSTPQGTWQTLAPAGLARHEISYVHVNGKFYLTGDRGHLTNEVYDAATNTWSTAAPLPSESHHAQAVELNGLVYYLGGLVSPYPDHVTPAVNIFNPAANTWSQGTPMLAGRARGGGGTASYNGKLYVAGGLQDDASGTGHNGVSVKLFDMYDPVSGTWTSLPDMPRARDHFHAAVVGNKFYAIGGRKGGDAGFFNAVIAQVDVYDFSTGAWSTLPESSNLPTPRAGAGTAVLGNEIIVIGGEGNGNAYNNVEAFNTVTQSWRSLAPMPTARHGIQAAVCNGGIYIAGGGLSQGGGSLTKIHQVFFLGSPTGCGGAAPPPAPIGFGKSTLGGTSGLGNPTSLQFGPDGRLYVSQQNGLIRIYTVTRNAANSYAVTMAETINTINSTPNHNDDGQVNVKIATRLITGLLVVGTSSNPVIYVAHSDPRIGGGNSGVDLNLDTNSSMISRLTWTGTSWQKLDVVRGLPRSEENHATNGMQLDPVNNILYVAMGGNTNKGAPSNNFALLPEFALSAAILSIDLTAIGNTTYDLPTLDDEDRPGNPDFNDPFGGNNGKNQAVLVPGGPVQVYAPGFRNPYDLVITQAGRMYSIDNGGNAGWGDIPIGAGPLGTCTNAVSEPGTTDPDSLHLITGAGYYGGHPNPTRANRANTFNSSNPQSPVAVANPIECDYRKPGPASGALVTFPASTNGLTEYTAGNFNGAMRGNLLTVSWNGVVQRVQLDSTGTTATQSSLFTSVGSVPLDIVAPGPASPFPGTIWVALYGGAQIVVFEPNDYEAAAPSCTGSYSWNLDEDLDGYSNADEIDNGTSPCSAADVPSDWDGDFLSDLNDPDDDNDGLPDVSDPFALDPLNGTATRLPVEYWWENDGSNPGGILNLGFTGLMTNGVSNYATLYNIDRMTAGGAAGVLTVDQVSEGDAFGALNTQEYGFQFGLWANPADTGTFFVHTRILGPFAGLTPQDGQSMGLFLGSGDQDNYAKIVVSGTAAGGIAYLQEVGGAVTVDVSAPVSLPGPQYIDLYLRVDPVRATVQPFYSVTSGGVTGPQLMLAAPQPVPASWFTNPNAGVAVGIISTSRGPGAPFPGTWDFIRAVPATDAPTLAVTPGTLNFGAVVVGGTQSRTLQLAHLGGADTADLVIDALTITGTGAGQFSHKFDNGGNVTLVPGETVTLTLNFSPTSAGDKAATLAITHSISSTPFQVPLTGSGVASGASTLGASPASLAFGSVTVGQSSALTVQLTNQGTTNLVVDATTITGTAAAQFSDDFNDASDITLAPGATTTVTVTFAPTSSGSKSATLEIVHSGTNTPLQVPLTGSGVAPPSPLLGASPTSLAFGNVTVGQSAGLTVQLTNQGTTNLVVDATTITGTAAAQFSDDFNDASDITLAPGATTTVRVTFAPTSTGSKTATLQIVHSGASSPVQIPLSGTGKKK